MAFKTHGIAVESSKASFKPFTFDRRDLAPKDVLIKNIYCGVCHSDIHAVEDHWHYSMYPLVPGHEMVGEVLQIGANVQKFKIGDIVGIGCFIDSCGECESCKAGEEHLCEKEATWTYNGLEQKTHIPTLGCYSSHIVVNENYILKIPENLPLANVAPLLCAGVTTYSLLRRYQVDSTKKIAIVGLGGLGHLAVKFAVAMGAHVTVFSTNAAKQQDALDLGAHQFIATNISQNLESFTRYFDLIVDTVSAQHDLNQYLSMLRQKGVLALVGAPEEPLGIDALTLIYPRRTIAGAFIGSIRETQEMLDYCGKNSIVSDVEIIPIQKIEEAFQRTMKGDVRYRFVLDLSSLSI